MIIHCNCWLGSTQTDQPDNCPMHYMNSTQQNVLMTGTTTFTVNQPPFEPEYPYMLKLDEYEKNGLLKCLYDKECWDNGDWHKLIKNRLEQLQPSTEPEATYAAWKKQHEEHAQEARLDERVACAALVIKEGMKTIRPTSDDRWLTNIAKAILARDVK